MRKLIYREITRKKIQEKRNLLNKDKISFKDIRKSNERVVYLSPMFEALYFIKLDYFEYLKLCEKYEKLTNEDIKVRKIMQEIFNKTKLRLFIKTNCSTKY